MGPPESRRCCIPGGKHARVNKSSFRGLLNNRGWSAGRGIVEAQNLMKHENERLKGSHVPKVNLGPESPRVWVRANAGCLTNLARRFTFSLFVGVANNLDNEDQKHKSQSEC